MLPIDAEEARHTKKRAKWFVLYDEILYKGPYARPLIRHITPEVRQKILEEIYEGVYSAHIGG